MDAIMGEEIEETGDFIVNEKDKVVNLTEAWCEEGRAVLPYREPGRSGESGDPAQHHPGTACHTT